MSILLAQRPHNLFVNLLGLEARLLGDLGDDRVDCLALFVLLLALADFFGRDSSFGEIDVAWKRGELPRIRLPSETTPYPFRDPLA